MSESRTKQKFSTQVDSALLAEFRALARAEGRSLQSLTEEALVKLIQTRQIPAARPHVMAAYQTVLEQYGSVFEKLAKL